MVLRAVRHIVHMIAVFLTIAALVFGIFFMILHFAGIKYYVIVSGSMEPSIKTGSVVFVDTDTADDASPGDVAAYEAADGVVVVHRLVAIEDDETYLFKGDANETSDFERVTGDQIIGVCEAVMPRAGYLFGYLGDTDFGVPVQMFYLIGMLVLVNVLDVSLTWMTEDIDSYDGEDSDEDDPDEDDYDDEDEKGEED